MHRKLGKAALFITMTTDLRDWPEVSTRLPVFNGKQQNAFDRAAIHAEVARCKAQAYEQELHRVRFSSRDDKTNTQRAHSANRTLCSGRYYRS